MNDLTNAPPPPQPPTADEVRNWLAYEYAPLSERAREMLAALSRFISAHPLILEDETQGKAADLREQVRALLKSAESARVAAKAPFISGSKAVDGFFALATAQVDAVLPSLIAAMNRYAKMVFEAEQAEAARQARLAREEANRKADAAVDAMSVFPPGSDGVRLATLDAQLAEEAAQVAARQVNAADVTRARGELGGTASLRTRWKWRVADITKIPPQYLDVNQSRVNAAFQAGGRKADGSPRITIPGIENYCERSV
jgi:hypothetical protein